MSFAILIPILAICLLLESFFSGSEMALVNADKYRLALAVDGGSKFALAALHMVKRPAKFFATTLLGTNICTVTGSVVTTIYIIENIGPEYSWLALAYWPFTLILGEIVPKSICQHYADRIVLKVSPILYVAALVMTPAVWLLSKLTHSLLGDVASRGEEETSLSREEIEAVLEMGGHETSDVRPTERTMISRIFDLADKRVKNIMTPLVDVAAIPVSATREEAASSLEKYGFSRIPLYEGRVFNIVGVLIGSDFIFEDETKPVRDLVKPAYYVPEEMPLDELLVAMKRRGEQIAVAVDEYGGATGIVTAEDLLEEVVGEIRDEHDEEPALYRRIGWHHYLVSGRMETDKLYDRLKIKIPSGDYETVAGFVIHRFEKIPKVGEAIETGNLKLTVHRATDRAVLEVEIEERVI